MLRRLATSAALVALTYAAYRAWLHAAAREPSRIPKRHWWIPAWW